MGLEFDIFKIVKDYQPKKLKAVISPVLDISFPHSISSTYLIMVFAYYNELNMFSKEEISSMRISLGFDPSARPTIPTPSS